MRGEMSLWMLTKFGMVFFIVSLSAIVLSVEMGAKQNICRGQTQAIANEIAGRITQVLESPAEDEQRAYAFQGGLSLARNDRVRYFVNITLRPASIPVTSGRLVVSVYPVSDPACERSSSVPYTRLDADKISLLPAPSRPVAGAAVRTISFSPSDLDWSAKSYYLVVLKCGNKLHPPSSSSYSRYLYVKDCVDANVSRCSILDSAAPSMPMADENICGFRA